MDPFPLDIAAAFSPAIPITFMACKEAQNASDETARNAPIIPVAVHHIAVTLDMS